MANNNEDFEKTKMLFEHHHAEIKRHRDRMYDIVKIFSGIFILLNGYVIAKDFEINCKIKSILIPFLIFLIGSCCWSLHRINRSYLENAKVIGKINTKLGLFEPFDIDKPKESFYPARWQRYGEKGIIGGFMMFAFWILTIGGITILTLIFL